jgi:hypothetical protein
MKVSRAGIALGLLSLDLALPARALAGVTPAQVLSERFAPVAATVFPGVAGLVFLIVWSLLHTRGQDEATIRAAARVGWDWVEDATWPGVRGERHRWLLVLPDGSVREASASLTFGSAPDNDVVLLDASVQPHHARLQWYGADLVFTDLAGRDTRVGGRPVRGRISLRRGTTLRLGRSEIAVHRDVSGLGGRPPLIA